MGEVVGGAGREGGAEEPRCPTRQAPEGRSGSSRSSCGSRGRTSAATTPTPSLHLPSPCTSKKTLGTLEDARPGSSTQAGSSVPSVPSVFQRVPGRQRSPPTDRGHRLPRLALREAARRLDHRVRVQPCVREVRRASLDVPEVQPRATVTGAQGWDRLLRVRWPRANRSGPTMKIAANRQFSIFHRLVSVPNSRREKARGRP